MKTGHICTAARPVKIQGIERLSAGVPISIYKLHHDSVKIIRILQITRMRTTASVKPMLWCALKCSLRFTETNYFCTIIFFIS